MQLSELKYYLDKLETLQKEFITMKEQVNSFVELHAKTLVDIKNILPEITRLKSQLYLNDYSANLNTYFSNYSDSEINIIGPRLTINSNFLFPGLYIGNEPRLANFLVASDPLYISSWNRKVLHSTLKRFNEKYQPKIRSYLLDKSNLALDNIFPKQQFSLIVCWDVVTFLSIKNTEFFINQLQKLLRPGGSLIFNFNNCDKEHKLLEAEKLSIPYQTINDIINICKNFNYVHHYNLSESIDYMVASNPGQLDTIKLQPVLDKIISKSS